MDGVFSYTRNSPNSRWLYVITVRYPGLLGCSRTVGVDEEGPWNILGLVFSYDIVRCIIGIG